MHDAYAAVFAKLAVSAHFDPVSHDERSKRQKLTFVRPGAKGCAAKLPRLAADVQQQFSSCRQPGMMSMQGLQ